MQNSPSYRGVLPRSDEAQERVLNAAGLNIPAANLAVIRVTEFDTNGNPTTGGGLPVWDYVAVTYAATTDTYVFRLGGAGGTVVLTIVITYVNSTKAQISTVTKS